MFQAVLGEEQYIAHSSLSGCFVFGVGRLVGIRLKKVLKTGFYLFFRRKVRPSWWMQII